MADEELRTVGIKFETRDIERASASLDTLAGKGDKVDASLEKVEAEAKDASKSIDGLGASARQADGPMGSLADSSSTLGSSLGLAKTAAIGFLGAIGVQQLLSLGKAFLASADATTNLNTQLKLATGTRVRAGSRIR